MRSDSTRSFLKNASALNGLQRGNASGLRFLLATRLTPGNLGHLRCALSGNGFLLTEPCEFNLLLDLQDLHFRLTVLRADRNLGVALHVVAVLAPGLDLLRQRRLTQGPLGLQGLLTLNAGNLDFLFGANLRLLSLPVPGSPFHRDLCFLQSPLLCDLAFLFEPRVFALAVNLERLNFGFEVLRPNRNHRVLFYVVSGLLACFDLFGQSGQTFGVKGV